MVVSFKDSAQTLTEVSSNSFFWDLVKIVAKQYVYRIKQMLPWSVLISCALFVNKFLIGDFLGFTYISIFLMIYILIQGLFYIETYLYDCIRPNLNFCLISAVPYALVPVLIIYFFPKIGLIFSLFYIVSFAFFVQEIVVKKSNMFDAYFNSMFLTWRYNIKLFLTLFMPFIFLVSFKIYLSVVIGMSYASWLYLAYLTSGILFLPWLAIVYAVFYEYLVIEKQDDV